MPFATEYRTTEIVLIDAMKAGRRAAFEAVIKANNRRLFRIVRGILKNEADAEDAVQETYARAFAHLDGFCGETSLGTWLARIAISEALRRLHHRGPHTIDLAQIGEQLGVDEWDSLSPVCYSSLEHAAARTEIRRLIEEAVDQLPSIFRVVFVMRVVEQMSIDDTAQSLGIPPETVKTRLYRATRRLRAVLGAEFSAIFDDSFPFARGRCERMTRSVLARMSFADPACDPPAV